MSNHLILTNLRILAKDAQSSKDVKDRFRARAYLNAIKSIEKCGYELTSGDDAGKLEGVGKKIAEKIQEILDTGKLHQVEELGEDIMEKGKSLNLFGDIWGVGPVKAKELVDAGARTLEDLEKPNFQDLLNENQRIGLKYYDDLLQRIPRWQVAEIVKKIVAEVRQIQRDLGWTVKVRVCGSFRRHNETCGDMDILLSASENKPILPEIVDRLTERGILIENLGLGKNKFMGITKTSTDTAFRIDMEVITEKEWPFALLYFTGSGPFNARQRLVAKKKGYSLSEYGMKDMKTGRFVQGLHSERDIFRFLGMEYLPPWERKAWTGV